MKITFLDFEQPVAELEAKIEELRFAQEDSAVDISAEISRLQKKSQSLTNSIYAKRGKIQGNRPLAGAVAFTRLRRRAGSESLGVSERDKRGFRMERSGG